MSQSLQQIVVVLTLLGAVGALVPVANRLGIPYPILLFLGGLAMGFIPALPNVALRPDLVFFLFLPSLLYSDAMEIPWREFRANLRPIVSLAIGLVILTTVGVAIVAHALLGMPLDVAFVLGAVLSSTDAVAAMSIAAHVGLSQRIVTILGSESLLNDATALVIYGSAVTAVAQGSFSLPVATLHFFEVSLGGVAIGLAIGFIWAQLRPLVNDVLVGGIIALLLPFAAYIPADLAGVSGVLAVVTTGLFVERRLPLVISPDMRLRAEVVSQLRTFLINGLLFILMGLELQNTLSRLTGHTLLSLMRDIAIISLAVIVVRFLWVYPADVVVRIASKIRRTRVPPLSIPETTIVGWSGMRGVIALASALALPTVAGAHPFPDRSYIIFLTMGVIMVTLVGQGLTLPILIRLLHLRGDRTLREEEDQARLATAQAALEYLDTLDPSRVPPGVLADLRTHYERRVELAAGKVQISPGVKTYRDLQHELLEIEHQKLIEMRDRNEISDEILRRVERVLDLEQVRLEAVVE